MRLMGIHGELTGQRFDLGTAPLTMGRGADNHVILSTRLASRHHAELRPDGGAWKAKGRGTSRRQQVVTVQSRQWRKLPVAVQERLFGGDAHTEMWPTGPDSVDDLPPRNVRIAYIEDQLLALANEAERIRL